jgi:hypothetical protein
MSCSSELIDHLEGPSPSRNTDMADWQSERGQ